MKCSLVTPPAFFRGLPRCPSPAPEVSVDGGFHGRLTPVGGRLIPRPPHREGAPAGNVGLYGTMGGGELDKFS